MPPQVRARRDAANASNRGRLRCLPEELRRVLHLASGAALGPPLDGSCDDPDEKQLAIAGMPSERLRAATDAAEVARLTLVLTAAFTAFVRPASTALRDAADAAAYAAHVEAFGCPPGDATTRELDADQEPWDGFYYWDYPEVSFNERTPRALVVVQGPPQAALVDRAHAVLALRAASFYHDDYGAALVETFWNRASAMPWVVDAWHVFVTCHDTSHYDEDDDQQDYRCRTDTGWRYPALPFDPRGAHAKDLEQLREFAAALPPPTGPQLAGLPEEAGGLTDRLDLFGGPTHWVDFGPAVSARTDARFLPRDRAGTRELFLRGRNLERGDRCTSGWWGSHCAPSKIIDEIRAEPPAEVIGGFCAFSFRPSYQDAHTHDEYHDEMFGPDIASRDCYYRYEDTARRRRGGFALRAADLDSPNGFDDDNGAVQLEEVAFEPGGVHLSFSLEGSPLVLTVSGTIPALPPRESSDAYKLRHEKWQGRLPPPAPVARPPNLWWPGHEADESYCRDSPALEERERFFAYQGRHERIAERAQALRLGLPRGRGTPRHPCRYFPDPS